MFCISLSFLLAACGGGGGGSPASTPTKVVVKLTTNGTLPALPVGLKIGGLGATISYPASKVSIIESNIVSSDNAASATLLANVATPGSVILGNLSLASGFDVGTFATLTFTIIGTLPSASDFTIDAGSTFVGGTDIPQTDLTSIIPISVQSVTFQ